MEAPDDDCDMRASVQSIADDLGKDIETIPMLRIRHILLAMLRLMLRIYEDRR